MVVGAVSTAIGAVMDLVYAVVNSILSFIAVGTGFILKALGLSKPTPKAIQCSHQPEPTLECPDCATEQTQATKYRWKIILGLILPFALQSLDTTMYDDTLVHCLLGPTC